jgi:hypothetical protein
MGAFCDWLLEAYIPLFQQLAPSRTRPRTWSLQDYFWPVTFFVKLIYLGERVVAQQHILDHKVLAKLAPAVFPQDELYSEVPRFTSSQFQ